MRRVSFVSIVGVCLLVLAGATGARAAVEWPGFRGPNHTGEAPGAKLFDGTSGTLTVGWMRALGSGYSALAVGDGRVVAMFAEGDGDFVAAFDAGSGEELWRHRIADTYAGHDGSHDGPISTPLMDGGRVYGLGAWGHLFAVDAATGALVWQTHLVDDQGSKKPHYGFTTSPLMADGVLVVELGAEGGKAVAGFDPATGKLLWTAGDDTFEYHSPIVAEIGGERQVLAAGKSNLFGLDAKSGNVLWKYEHAGDDRAMGGMTIVPVPAGHDRVFLMNKVDSSVMLKVEKKAEAEYAIGELWSGNAIKSSYVVPVYKDGFLYGMSNRVFVCVDADNGEIRWRSREPGDGFPTVVGDHIVINTKPGILAVIEASPEAYTEVARLEVFGEHSWSEVAYAGGHLYARSMGHLARIDVASAAAADGGSGSSWVASTAFGRFLAELEQAPDKNAAIEAFMARQPDFPIVEESTGAVHFVYRGLVNDVGIVGDMIGFRREDPMNHVAGTDLFHYSMRLEPDAAVTYGFLPDFGDAVADPLNDAHAEGLFGKVSWFAMPGWVPPDFLEAAETSRQGRMETVEWESAAREGQKRKAEVYLPAGYDRQSDRRYPVVYVHNGQEALDAGMMKNALDRLIGEAIDPVIAVFVIPEGDARRDMGEMDPYTDMVVKELVPAIDGRFRTIAEPWARASAGAGRGANVALQGALKHPEVFGRVAAQSATFDVATFKELNKGADEQPLVAYLEWGTYHLRSPHEAWDLADENRKLWTAMREAGYRPAGGEVPEGYGWPCWNGHTDDWLRAMFPLTRPADDRRAAAGAPSPAATSAD